VTLYLCDPVFVYIQIEIWERGAGYTLASGSSSTAAAAVAYKLGLCNQTIAVHMPGGNLTIRFSQKFGATMIGPVTRICEGIMCPEMFEEERPSNNKMQRTGGECLSLFPLAQ